MPKKAITIRVNETATQYITALASEMAVPESVVIRAMLTVAGKREFDVKAIINAIKESG